MSEKLFSDGSDPKRAVEILLSGGKVTAGFRSAVFDAANRRGLSVNEFALEAVGSWLKAAMYEFPAIFPADAENSVVKTRVDCGRRAKVKPAVGRRGLDK